MLVVQNVFSVSRWKSDAIKRSIFYALQSASDTEVLPEYLEMIHDNNGQSLRLHKDCRLSNHQRARPAKII